jgi:hypothetical protein
MTARTVRTMPPSCEALVLASASAAGWVREGEVWTHATHPASGQLSTSELLWLYAYPMVDMPCTVMNGILTFEPATIVEVRGSDGGLLTVQLDTGPRLGFVRQSQDSRYAGAYVHGSLGTRSSFFRKLMIGIAKEKGV